LFCDLFQRKFQLVITFQHLQTTLLRVVNLRKDVLAGVSLNKDTTYSSPASGYFEVRSKQTEQERWEMLKRT
jgi:hypothetical protein